MKRDWTVFTVTEDGEQDFSEVGPALEDLATVLLRCGGVGAIAPHRVQLSDGSYAVDRVVFKYDSYAPGLNRQQQQNGNAAVDPDPVPIEVETAVAAEGESAEESAEE